MPLCRFVFLAWLHLTLGSKIVPREPPGGLLLGPRAWAPWACPGPAPPWAWATLGLAPWSLDLRAHYDDLYQQLPSGYYEDEESGVKVVLRV